ncbi:U6 small nuclear RNA -methyltransferase [Erysiphe neolycopersici]|uniref:U6 small nuclear RNA-methyltransferase n=1 Tax=Erysiphe neolycopersici TaxID=212602 RepID=A0A420H8D3_9PEZI|nr:U6 small nuclear RNA -methyltransferase [Erysiphe neolycopersici]
MIVKNNIYQNGINFSTLALVDSEFAKYLKPNGQLDFSDPNAVQQLTKSLLKRDFGLSVVLPQDRLCPPVPNRLNYILWVQRLLDTTDIKLIIDWNKTVVSSSNTENNSRNDVTVYGLDIGTGASCIYPLLGCALRNNWKLFGTDTDEKSLEYARQNVTSNHLSDRISIVKTEPREPLIPFQVLGVENLKFIMCNPPFYESKEEMLKCAEAKKRPPFTACTGADFEMVTEGGEVEFISRLIDESTESKSRVQWYTSMIGKLSNLIILREKLVKLGINNYALTDFVQGNKTKRWAIAWSFDDLRPPMDIARGLKSVPKSLLPFPSQYTFTLNLKSPSEVGEKIDTALSQLSLIWRWDKNSLTGKGVCDKDVWSRASRRKNMIASQEKHIDIANKCLSFGFEIQANDFCDAKKCNQVMIRWVKGHDTVLFESFCGMIKRKCSG